MKLKDYTLEGFGVSELRKLCKTFNVKKGNKASMVELLNNVKRDLTTKEMNYIKKLFDDQDKKLDEKLERQEKDKQLKEYVSKLEVGKVVDIYTIYDAGLTVDLHSSIKNGFGNIHTIYKWWKGRGTVCRVFWDKAVEVEVLNFNQNRKDLIGKKLMLEHAKAYNKKLIYIDKENKVQLGNPYYNAEEYYPKA